MAISIAPIPRRVGLSGHHPSHDRGLRQYLDRNESDVFILSGAEDLIPGRRRRWAVARRDA